MFVIDQKDSFTWPVEFEIPGDGKPTKGQIVAEFKRVPQSRLDSMMNPDTAPQDEDLVREVMIGWKEVKDETGADLEYNAVNLNRLLEVAGMRRAICMAFLQAMMGGGKRKN